MNIIAKLTARHLLGNKKRSVVTILGIATSTALISAILLGVFSFFRFFAQISIRSDGNIHANFTQITKEQTEELRNDPRINLVGICDTEETITGVRLLNDKEDRFRIGNIDHLDIGALNMMVISDYEGTLPQNAGEIAVEEQFLKDNDLDLTVGDILTFEEGYRYIDNELEGFYYLGGGYRSEEQFEALSTDTCTITAILHGNPPTSSWDILRGMDPSYFPSTDKADVRITLKSCDHTAIRQIKEIAADHGLSHYGWNTEYMLSVFAFEDSEGSFRSFFLLMGLALLIAILTSVVLIVNSIGMSLTERLRYLGMLSSVGATARQKRFSIYFEGLILGIVGIPLGLLLGYIGTRITLSVVGSKMLAANILVEAEGMTGGIPIVCAPIVIFAIILFSALTILIACLTPAIRAAKVTPIDALRQSNVVKVKARKLKVNPLVQKLFGYEGELAYKNIKRNGIKGTVITVSIAISVILFLTINYFCGAITRANSYDFNLPCQLFVSCRNSESDKLREELLEMDDVERVFTGGTIEFMFTKNPKLDNAVANTAIADPAFRTESFADMPLNYMSVVILDDEDFKQMLSANDLPEETFFSGTLRAVLLNGLFHEEGEKEIFNDQILGQVLHYDETMGFPPAIEIAGFVTYRKDNGLFEMVPKGNVCAYVPASMYYEKAKETLPEDTLTRDLCVVTGDHNAVHRKVSELLAAEGYHNYSVEDVTDTIAAMSTVTLMLKTAMYGFTILLTLVAIANIVNTISTGVLLRRKEFAMYKSVGMTEKGFAKMLRLETILYGVKALLWGLPIAALLSFCMYQSFDDHLYSFDPDLFMYGIACIVVFLVVGLSMLLSISKIKGDSIIEALKEDAV